MAITGPFVRTLVLRNPAFFGNPIVFNKRTTWYRQGSNPKVPLPFTMSLTQRTDGDTGSSIGSDNVVVGSAEFPQERTQAYNTAYGKFVESMGEQSQWAVNFLEREQSVTMIEKRAMQLYRFARALNRFDFVAASKEFAVPQGLRNKSKSIANLWLETHFGWSPAVQDIHAGLSTLSQTPPPLRLKGKGSQRVRQFQRADLGSVWTDTLKTGQIRWLIQAEARVTNANLYTMSTLGLTNPASWIWEKIPFSFVVDWFGNVGQFLGSFSDLQGVTLTNPFRTSYDSFFRMEDTIRKTDGARLYSHGGPSAYVVRTTGTIPGPKLAMKPLKAPSVVRAATAISLLLQQLR